MSGHGHVIPNEDGSRARCGGPSICPECSKEAAQVYAVKLSKLVDDLTQVKAERDTLQEAGTMIANDLAAALRHARDLADERDALQADLEWIERNFFERKWSGTLGEPSYWQMVGPYRHTLQKMRGETLRAAIDAARQTEGA